MTEEHSCAVPEAAETPAHPASSMLDDADGSGSDRTRERPRPTPHRLPTDDRVLADGRRLVYEGLVDEWVGDWGAPLPGAAFRTADGLLVIVTLAPDAPGGAAFRLSVSYRDRTPSPEELRAVCAALCGPDGQFRAHVPRNDAQRRHGYVILLVEEPLARPNHPSRHGAEIDVSDLPS